jgi:hypothetical protein
LAPSPNCRCGRRADIFALASDAAIFIVEIKSSVADFRADTKWRARRAHCDRMFFAIPETVLSVRSEWPPMPDAHFRTGKLHSESPNTSPNTRRKARLSKSEGRWGAGLAATIPGLSTTFVATV